MQIVNRTFKSELDKHKFVMECEDAFEDRLNRASNAITSVPNLRVVTLSGPTCSGKTTTANKLICDLSQLNKTVHVISIDDFFKTADQIPKGAPLDFDSVNALDLEYLAECVDGIYKNIPVRIPKFNFSTGMRDFYTEFHPDGKEDVLIFEGIQAIYPEVTALFENSRVLYESICICVFEDVKINGVSFSKDDIRLMRRIVRDYKFRSASPEYTFFLWDSVRDNEEKNIYPHMDKVNVKIDSFMPYEVFMLKPYLEELLPAVKAGVYGYEKAQELLLKIREFEPILDDYLPERSMYHEFLG